MERKIAKKLLLWKDNPERMSLILHGARQIGKTYMAALFCLRPEDTGG